MNDLTLLNAETDITGTTGNTCSHLAIKNGHIGDLELFMSIFYDDALTSEPASLALQVRL